MEKPQHYFYANNAMDIPLVRLQTITPPQWLAPYQYRIRRKEFNFAEGAVHFFIDDRRFEVAYNKPIRVLKAVQSYGLALTPDFSLFIGMPRAIQIFNIYRARWVGAYWQQQGVTVVSTITWGDETSFEFCFLGVEKGTTVAISTVGAGEGDNFSNGYKAMIESIDPQHVLCFGTLPEDLQSLAAHTTYPSDKWKNGRVAIQRTNWKKG